MKSLTFGLGLIIYDNDYDVLRKHRELVHHKKILKGNMNQLERLNFVNFWICATAKCLVYCIPSEPMSLGRMTGEVA